MKLSRKGQKGQTLIIFAVAAVALIGLASIAIDQGLAQADRRNLQAVADGASLAGTRQYSVGGDINAAHFVAMQYLVAAFGGTTGTCTVSSCSDGPWPVGAYSFTFADSGTNNQTMDVSISHTRPSLIAAAIGYSTETVGTGARSRPVPGSNSGGGLNVAALDGMYQVNGAGTCNPSGNITGNVYSFGAFGSNNNGNGSCHTVIVPHQLSGLTGTPPTLGVCNPSANTTVSFNGDMTVNTGGWAFDNDPTIHPGNPTANANVLYNQNRPLTYDSSAPRPPGASYTGPSDVTAKDPLGNWKPGTYNNFVPTSGPGLLGRLNGGVYLIRGVASPDLSNSVQLNAGIPGAPDDGSSIVFVLDSSDTGDVTIASHNTTTFNGFEGTTAGSDTVGTHNFVLFGGPSNDSGSTKGFQGNVHLLNSTDVPVYTGIIYMPNSSIITKGNLPYAFYGSVYLSNFTLDGGGHNGQGFQYICGLGSIESNTIDGALIR